MTPGGSIVVPPPVVTPDPEPDQNTDNQPSGTDYVVNTNTGEFHYPSCSSVKKMKESNKMFYTGTRDDLISKGYSPCGNCHP
jgi:methylphosphotriester-DNA--protein-cysteine methyltransferase